MKAYVFPGQGAQFPGMGKALSENSREAAIIFNLADSILGFPISQTMFEGTEEDLRQTNITQPAVFIHSVAAIKALGNEFQPAMAAGHSLGELSALTAVGALSFEDGLRLVHIRASAMQKACEMAPSTMAAILGLEDDQVKEICDSIDETVVAANYNSPGQLVISGTLEGVKQACEKLTAAGAKRAIQLSVGGAFHSPLMEPAREKLATAIDKTNFKRPQCPVYQNADAAPHTVPDEIKANLKAQLTAPVKWTQSIQNMIRDGAVEFVEAGPGRVLQTLIKKIDRSTTVSGIGN